MSAPLAVGSRVRLITNASGVAPTVATYGTIDAKQAGVYRVRLDNGESVLVHRSALAFQNRALVAKQRASEAA